MRTIGIIAVTVVGTWFEAFSIVKFWKWFIVPATGFHEIGISIALGLTATVALFRKATGASDDWTVTNWIFESAVLLGVAWLTAGIALCLR